MGAGEVILLLVEDDPLVRFVSQEVLEDAGYTVMIATSGSEAETLLLEHHAIIAAVVTDIRLGEDPDGWGVARRAREINPVVGVVYATGDSASEWAHSGVSGSILLKKPFRDVELVSAVADILVSK